MIYFPKYKYHPIHIMTLVKSAEEEMALVGEWFDSPAHFPALQSVDRVISPLQGKLEKEVSEAQAFATSVVTKGKRK